MKRGPVLLIILWLVGAFVLAFPLRSAVEQLIIAPLAYFLWMLGVLYRAIPQPLVWLVVLLVMFYVALGSFYGRPSQEIRPDTKPHPARGPLESLATLISQKTPGVVLQVANRAHAGRNRARFAGIARTRPQPKFEFR